MKVIQFQANHGQYGDTIRVLTQDGRMFEVNAPNNKWGWSEIKLPKAIDFEENEPDLENIKLDIEYAKYAVAWLYRMFEAEQTITFNKGSVLHDRVKRALCLED